MNSQPDQSESGRWKGWPVLNSPLMLDEPLKTVGLYAAIDKLVIENVRLEKEAVALTVERDQLQDAAGAAMAAIRATDFAKAHRVLYDALHPKPARAEEGR